MNSKSNTYLDNRCASNWSYFLLGSTFTKKKAILETFFQCCGLLSLEEQENTSGPLDDKLFHFLCITKTSCNIRLSIIDIESGWQGLFNRLSRRPSNILQWCLFFVKIQWCCSSQKPPTLKNTITADKSFSEATRTPKPV